MTRIKIATFSVLLLALVAAPAALAGGPMPDYGEGQLAEVLDDGRTLFWRMGVEHEAVVLTVSTPCGPIERLYKAGEEITFNPAEAVSPDDPDGRYSWQIRIVPVVSSEVRKALQKARAEGDDELLAELRRKGLLPQGPFLQTGSFTVQEGSIVPRDEEEKESARVKVEAVRSGQGATVGGFDAATGGAEVATAADVVYNDDLIVIGSLCVGFDCVNGEVFSFDTIRLKENNLRIKFDDTSGGSFPTRNWEIEVNSSANGGQSHFRINDVDGARSPFTIEAAAPSHSLYVDSTGRVGMRTATPVLDLHISTSNTPGIRLEQTSSGGFTAQTWDIAGNEANFFVRDVTGGSRLPFRIRPGAPTSSIDISATGNVGIGTASPNVDLHIRKTAEAATDVQFKIEANTDPAFDFAEQDSGVTWRFINNNTVLKIADVGTGADGAEELTFTQAGDLTITGEIFTSGSCVGGCDLVFSPDYALPSIEEHAEAMFTNRHLPSVGPTPENGPFNLSRMAGGMLNELEKAHIYIAQLAQEKRELEERLSRIEKLLEVQENTADSP